MENKFLKLKNLNNSWVITKVHNGNTFFVHRKYVTCIKNYPSPDCIFNNEDQVKIEVERLNKTRKKCKYKYENASKYFVNDWSYNNYSNIIENKALSIKKVSQNTKLKNLNEVKNEHVKKMSEQITFYSINADRLKNDLPKKIEELKKAYESDIQRNIDIAKQMESDLESFNNINLNQLLEEFETQGDKMVKVLFGSNK